MPGRYGASGDNPRMDPSFNFEEGYADPQRTIGPIRATTSVPSTLAGPVSIGADTGCTNAILRVSGGGHFAGRVGIGVCPTSTVPGMDIEGHINPATDASYALGSSALGWADLYLASLGSGSGIVFHTTGANIFLNSISPSVMHFSFGVGSGEGLYRMSGTYFLPNVDGGANLGSGPTNLRWDNLYVRHDIVGGLGGSTTSTKLPGLLSARSSVTTSSVSEVSLRTETLPASTLSSTVQTLRIRCGGQWSVASVNNQVRIKFGATYIATITGGAAANEFWIESTVTWLTSTTQQALSIETLDTDLGAATVALERTAPAETTTGTITIDFRGKVGSGTLNIDFMTVEVLAQL